MENNNTMELLKEKLKATGFKITPQRRAIIEVLIENESSHMSSEEIYDKVRVNCPEIGLATVYRTMQLLDEINGISKLNLDDGSTISTNQVVVMVNIFSLNINLIPNTAIIKV